MGKSGQNQLFRTSAWMRVGRAMQEQRSGVPSRYSILGQAPIHNSLYDNQKPRLIQKIWAVLYLFPKAVNYP